ncbi:hypothetical protein [Peribacillus frigoritolerans]|jgi:hypothetical protein|uniref:hypothetical protein n=1 Tax=Peribacillus frigoritolerans TaxID=450367 RepID=UPI002E1B547D|nr:hypothetical protein [Peribacillus frigoritolerans]
MADDKERNPKSGNTFLVAKPKPVQGPKIIAFFIGEWGHLSKLRKAAKPRE